MGQGNSGLSLRVWAVVREIPRGVTFSAADLFRAHPGLADGEKPLMAIGRALHHLVQRRGCEIRDRHRFPGDTWSTTLYARIDDHLHALPVVEHEPPPPKIPGVRRVHFPNTWKPYREDNTSRPWRGYQSALSRIE